MNAIEARRLTKIATDRPTISKYINEIDIAIKDAANEGLYTVSTYRMKWQYVIALKDYYKSQGFFVAKHNTTDLDNAPYLIGYLTISWIED